MTESNIYFVTNTLNYGGEYSGETKNKFNEDKGNTAFFRKVMDYDALMKLKRHPKMRGSTNSYYYVFHINQIHVIDPNFSSAIVHRREPDPKIEKENKKNDAIYGYPEQNDYYPLMDEIIISDDELSYADEMLGKWDPAGQDGSDGKIYIRVPPVEPVRPEDAGFEDIDDSDPYYYIYEGAAGKEKEDTESVDKARLYEAMYGSIFKAFSEVPQEKIIQAPINQYSFVNAGPGTGKTYTLMRKITYMIDMLGADPDGILVLCFTNAAVNEIKDRIKRQAENEGDRTFINVDVRTFHSFSWLLINQANEIFHDRQNYHDIDITKLNYDQSIREATRIIENFGDEVFGSVEHLIVDEIQDLTNERAMLVMAMAQECMKNGVGITILGDSCQAIYDYSDEDTPVVLKSDRFYKYMFTKFFERGELYKLYKLEKNHRQNNWLIETTAPLRRAILDGEEAPVREAIYALDRNVDSLISGPLSSKLSTIQLDSMSESGTLCLMCRNNAQVLATSTNLRKRGIKHIVNAYNEFEYLAGWIGKIFSLFTKNIVSYDEFENKLESVTSEIRPMEVWSRLQDVIGKQNNVLKITDILSAVAKSRVDDPVFRNVPRGNLIVSNIHRSKGREYDSVVVEKKFVNRLMSESASIKGSSQYLEEAKVLYVAVTRPRANLYFNNLATTDVSMKKIRTGRKRWVKGDGRNLKRVEIRALSDADIMSYNRPDLQKYIIKSVSEGDEINLVMNVNAGGTIYDIFHESYDGERKIGNTTREFIEDIEAITEPYGSPLPRRIKDLYVSGIHSQIAPDFQSVWCWVDFCGLGTAVSDVY